MHLNAEDIVDIAEGTRSEAGVPHLAACDACRQQVTDLRAMLSAAAEVDVPEPSPLFWDHFSARVRDAVAAEAAPRRSWFGEWSWTQLLTTVSAVAVAALLVVVALNSRAIDRRTPATALQPASLVADAGAQVDLLGDAANADDASLMLVTDLTAGMDADAAGEAGLTGRGSAEHAVTHMSNGELRELQRLLRDELSGSGA